MKLKSTLSEIKLLGATGLVTGGLGYAGLRLTETLVKPATAALASSVCNGLQSHLDDGGRRGTIRGNIDLETSR